MSSHRLDQTPYILVFEQFSQKNMGRPDESGYGSLILIFKMLMNLPGEIDRIRAEELKELQKLREMERRKQAIEEEIAKEKQHLINLQLLELDSIEKARSSGYSGRYAQI